MISASAVATRHELIMSLVVGLNPIMQVWKRTQLIRIKICAVMARIFSCSGRCAKISLEFYGQSAIFDHFVRNRHFSGRPFTDSMPIFIDVSVNGSDFAKCSAARQLLNRCI